MPARLPPSIDARQLSADPPHGRSEVVEPFDPDVFQILGTLEEEESGGPLSGLRYLLAMGHASENGAWHGPIGRNA